MKLGELINLIRETHPDDYEEVRLDYLKAKQITKFSTPEIHELINKYSLLIKDL